MPDSPKDRPAQTKPCPICGEPIKPSAKKCIHCNEFLEGHTGWRWANWLVLKPRTIWDLMGLLVVPVALACCDGPVTTM